MVDRISSTTDGLRTMCMALLPLIMLLQDCSVIWQLQHY